MKHTFKMYLGVGVDTWNEGQFALHTYNPDDVRIEHRSSALVREVEIELDVPDAVDLNSLKLKNLEEALAQDKAESHVRQNLLLEQISKLKCLTHEEG